jgi:Heterokaryon incompatibility protein (HET)
MRLGFTIGGIPATFRDAVLVTQTLGVQYLWIDSLCIIQGDMADLAQELSMMGDVYANSYVSITGAIIADDTHSFLKERSFDSTLLRIVSNRGSVAEVYLQNCDSRSRFFDQIINNPFKSFCN